MRIYVIAGEASGDMHGANLVSELKALHSDDLELRGWGGDRMAAEGVELVRHIRDLAFMGFAEVVMNLKTILSNISFCKEDIRQFAPDALILIDYPGFNLRLAPFAKAAGIKVLYYISPQVWAWKSNRVHAIKKNVDRMFTILPFEAEFYSKYDMEVSYVGHPLLDELKRNQLTSRRPQNVLALLPGSRKQEIKKMLPIMISAAEAIPEVEIRVAAAPSIPDEYYRPFLRGRASLWKDGTYNLLNTSRAAMVTSGTATLETALIGCPEVVCYKGGEVSYQIAKRLVKLDYISLVNLIMDRAVVKELIQSELTVKNLRQEVEQLLNNSGYAQKMEAEFSALRKALGGPGASRRCAEEMLKIISAD